jgi:hypothetical protein
LLLASTPGEEGNFQAFFKELKRSLNHLEFLLSPVGAGFGAILQDGKGC